MKKFKKLASAFLAVSMAFAPVTAMAAETTDADVAVQINGSDLAFTDAKPIIVDSRVFVPFRAVFEGLDAQISYDDTTKTITASKDAAEAKFVVGEKNITITKDGKTETVETDAASFVKANRTYVPVRFAAQALDCTVGWDAEEKTAIIVENNLFSPKEGTTYEIMNKYLAYANEFAKNTYAITGKLNLDIVANDGEEDLTISGVSSISGVTDANNLNMDMIVDLDLSKVEEMMKAEGAVDADTTAMLESLKKMDFNFIMNMETGKFYINSSLFSKLMGSAENTWYLIDLDQMLAATGLNFAELMKASKVDDFSKQIEAIVKEIPVNDKYATMSVIQSIKMIEGLYADKAFTKTDNGYVSKYTEEIEGAATSMEFALTMNGDKIEGYKINSSVSFEGKEIMSMTAAQQGLKVTMDMKMGMEPFFNMSVNGDMEYSTTTNKPVSAPDKSANIINLMDMFAITASEVETATSTTVVSE